MITWKTAFILIAIFLAGSIAGGFVGARIACAKAPHRPSSKEFREPPRRPVEEWSRRFEHEVIKRVGVTPEQWSRLEVLVQKAQADFRHLREQSFQKAGEVTEQFDRDVMAVLTPEQQPKYQELIKERQDRLKKIEAERFSRARAPGMEPPPATPPAMPAPEEKAKQAEAPAAAP